MERDNISFNGVWDWHLYHFFCASTWFIDPTYFTWDDRLYLWTCIHRQKADLRTNGDWRPLPRPSIYRFPAADRRDVFGRPSILAVESDFLLRFLFLDKKRWKRGQSAKAFVKMARRVLTAIVFGTAPAQKRIFSFSWDRGICWAWCTFVAISVAAGALYFFSVWGLRKVEKPVLWFCAHFLG